VCVCERKGREGKEGRKEGKGCIVSFGLAWGWVGMLDWRLGGIGVGVGVGVVDVDGEERKEKKKNRKRFC